ncbi:MAG TPA: DUF6036 family nucleotidyltransferase [Rhodocyclaceae bacterium]
MFYLDLFRTLDQHRVRYLLVGGLALNIHGVERATMDVDLALALDDENLGAFIGAAQALRLQPVAPVPLADLALPERRLSWIEEKNLLAFALRPPDPASPTVDILIKPGIDFEAAWARRIEKTLGPVHVQLIGIDDLIAMKSATGRQRDRSDVEALQRLRQLGGA